MNADSGNGDLRIGKSAGLECIVAKWERWSKPDNEPSACDAQKREGIAKIRDAGFSST